MREGSVKVITDKLLSRQEGLREKITQQLKTEKPFAEPKVPVETRLWADEHCGTMDMMELRQEFGDEAVNLMLFNLEKLRTDGRRRK